MFSDMVIMLTPAMELAPIQYRMTEAIPTTAEPMAIGSHHPVALKIPHAAMAKPMMAANTNTWTTIQMTPVAEHPFGRKAGVIQRNVVPNSKTPISLRPIAPDGVSFPRQTQVPASFSPPHAA